MLTSVEDVLPSACSFVVSMVASPPPRATVVSRPVVTPAAVDTAWRSVSGQSCHGRPAPWCLRLYVPPLGPVRGHVRRPCGSPPILVVVVTRFAVLAIGAGLADIAVHGRRPHSCWCLRRACSRRPSHRCVWRSTVRVPLAASMLVSVEEVRPLGRSVGGPPCGHPGHRRAWL